MPRLAVSDSCGEEAGVPLPGCATLQRTCLGQSAQNLAEVDRRFRPLVRQLPGDQPEGAVVKRPAGVLGRVRCVDEAAAE